MRADSKLLCGILFLILLGVGCKKSETKEPSTSQLAPASSSAAPTAPSAAATTAAASGAVAGTAEVATKMAAAEWALKQDEIKHDPNGQWAIQATASSTYNDAQGNDSFAANQVTGPPNVTAYADNGLAWAPKEQDAGIEWIDLKYPSPVHATAVRVRESFGSGAVVKIELFDDQGVAHTVWAGNDPTTDLNYLVVNFPKTAYATARVKVTLATNVIPGWNEIDAVQLVGTDQ